MWVIPTTPLFATRAHPPLERASECPHGRAWRPSPGAPNGNAPQPVSRWMPLAVERSVRAYGRGAPHPGCLLAPWLLAEGPLACGDATERGGPAGGARAACATIPSPRSCSSTGSQPTTDAQRGSVVRSGTASFGDPPRPRRVGPGVGRPRSVGPLPAFDRRGSTNVMAGSRFRGDSSLAVGCPHHATLTPSCVRPSTSPQTTTALNSHHP